MLLKEKTALITGCAGGIGKVAAQLMAGQGARVGLVDLNPAVEDVAKLIQQSGGTVYSIVADISDSQGVETAVAGVENALGPIDILVNNAGIVDNIASVSRMSDEAWEREISVNLSAAFKLIRRVVEPMANRGWGRIVNVSSLGAHGAHLQPAYSASKAGLIGLTKSVTKEFASRGVSCNVILPGLIQTEKVNTMPTEIVDAFLEATPAGRLGKMEEIAHLIMFLTTEPAGFINGAEINIDGGLRLGNTTLNSRKTNRRG